MLVSWLLSRLCIEDTGLVEINSLYERFKFEVIESGSDQPVPSQIMFIQHLKVLFPDAVRRRKRDGSPNYKGISITPQTYLHRESLSFTDDVHIPAHYKLKKYSATEIHCETESGYYSNGHSVNKTVILHSNCQWELSVGGKTVDLKKLFIDSNFALTSAGVGLVFNIADKLKLCSGVKAAKSVVVSKYHTLDNWQAADNICIRSVRSLTCTKVVPINSITKCCRTCQSMTFSVPKDKENKKCTNKTVPNPASSSNMDEIKKLFPNASDSMLELLLEQSKNVGRNPNGRRWSKKFMGFCLQLYNSSSHCYEFLSQSQMLVLPSISNLISYKNSVKQKPGLDDQID